MTNFRVTLMKGFDVKKVFITMGNKANIVDVIEEVKRRGYEGEVLGVDTLKY